MTTWLTMNRNQKPLVEEIDDTPSESSDLAQRWEHFTSDERQRWGSFESFKAFEANKTYVRILAPEWE